MILLKFTQKIKKNKGFIALISVLVVGIVGLVVSIALLLLGLGASRTSFALEQSLQSRALANTCAEEALERIRRLPTYTGSGNLTFDYGSCAYTITDLGGSNREIQATGTVDSIVRKVKVNINQVSPVNVTSWQEIADF
ncbi:hypothetical protein JW766_04425 [Candidatus Dojkabacteria bacterium]|nr:hypothetical protein [Candidatus Dojkabacteria bacterium]